MDNSTQLYKQILLFFTITIHYLKAQIHSDLEPNCTDWGRKNLTGKRSDNSLTGDHVDYILSLCNVE